MQNGGLRTKRAYPIREKEDLFQLWLFLRLWDSPRIGKEMQFSLYIVRIEICTSTTTITARKMPKVGQSAARFSRNYTRAYFSAQAFCSISMTTDRSVAQDNGIAVALSTGKWENKSSDRLYFLLHLRFSSRITIVFPAKNTEVCDLSFSQEKASIVSSSKRRERETSLLFYVIRNAESSRMTFLPWSSQLNRYWRVFFISFFDRLRWRHQNQQLYIAEGSLLLAIPVAHFSSV